MKTMNRERQVIISISGLEGEIHQLINQQRQMHDLPLLAFDPKLADIARQHSQDMAQRNFFSHQTPEGKTPSDRGQAAHYNSRKDYKGYFTYGLGENIFMSHIYHSVTYYNQVPKYDWMTQSDIAQSTVDGWMSSPGHRQNILTACYDKEGIGVAICKERNQVYVTENFC